MYRRPLAVALIALGALIPAAAAEATTFEGTCSLDRGSYALTESSYSFSSTTLLNGTCSGTLNDVAAGYAVTYSSAGAGSFQCAGGLFGSGDGRLDFHSVDVFTQRFTYVDTLDLRDGDGVLLAGGLMARKVAGVAGGAATQEARLTGRFCDPKGGVFSSTIATLPGETLSD